MKTTYKKAIPADAKLLTETAFTSKNNWGYPAECMELWRENLTISENYILENEVIKIFQDGKFRGFYALCYMGSKKWEIDHFWLLPDELGKGIGRQTFTRIMLFLQQKNAEKLQVVSDPNSNGFYEKMGGKFAGKFASVPEGRELDVLEYIL